MAGRKRNFNLIGLSSSIFSSQFLNIMVGMVLWKPPDKEVRCWEDERGGPSSSLHLHILVSLAQRAWLWNHKSSSSTGFENLWDCDEKRIRCEQKGDGGFTDQVPLLNYWWMYEPCKASIGLCFPWFPWKSGSFGSVTEGYGVSNQVYVEGLVPNQLGHGHLQTQWDSPILQPSKPRPFKGLLEHSRQNSVLYPFFIPCPLPEAQPHVGSVSGLGQDHKHSQDYWRLPPPSFTISSMPGPQSWVSVIFLSYFSSMPAFPSRLGPENLPKFC